MIFKRCKDFNIKELEEISKLLREKVSVNSRAKGRIRNKIRKLGFYISNFRDSGKEFNVEDFDDLLDKGEIKIAQKLINNLNK